MAPLRLLLGPQRPTVNIHSAMKSAGFGDGPISVISAGWQEAEGDLGGLQEFVKNPLSDLRIYQRAEQLFAADTALHEAYRMRQSRLQEQQRFYRLRLRQLAIAARATLRTDGDRAIVAAERRHAVSQLRALDRHHLSQVRKLHARLDAAISAGSHPLLEEHAAAIRNELSQFETVLITGGNVVVLMNRLRLFGLPDLLRDKNIVAWSAGAMALCDRIVLFHDKLPQGRRDAEILATGTSIVPGIVVLPDATHRLRSGDALRVSLFDRRFSPDTCMTLNNGALLLFDGESLKESKAVKRMTRTGKFRRVRAA